jgi:hypothetical protein
VFADDFPIGFNPLPTRTNHLKEIQTMPIIIETFEEFVERNGDYVEVGGHLFFESGASGMRADGQQPYNLTEPPADDIQCLRARKRYYDQKISEETIAFNVAKNQYLADCNYALRFKGSVPAPPDAVEQLKRGAERVRKLRSGLAEVSEQLRELGEYADERHERNVRQQLNDSMRFEAIQNHSLAIAAVSLDNPAVNESAVLESPSNEANAE